MLLRVLLRVLLDEAKAHIQPPGVIEGMGSGFSLDVLYESVVLYGALGCGGRGLEASRSSSQHSVAAAHPRDYHGIERHGDWIPSRCERGRFNHRHRHRRECRRRCQRQDSFGRWPAGRHGIAALQQRDDDLEARLATTEAILVRLLPKGERLPGKLPQSSGGFAEHPLLVLFCLEGNSFPGPPKGVAVTFAPSGHRRVVAAPH